MAEHLYRAMRLTSDAKPELGRTARTLGARPAIDILVDHHGTVTGGAGGMSVAPDSVANLPAHRRPPEHGGTGKDPIWVIAVVAIGDELAYRDDPLLPGVHGFIEPSRRMPFDEYDAALRATASAWRLLL